MIEIRELVIEARIEADAAEPLRELDERALERLARQLRRELRDELRDALQAQKEEAPWRFSNVR
ncbi:TPA: hypothetical protein SMQ86_006056 [Pseudomonas aeruginosa]|nr:hypothetical protein [Pseudomonas aeruginosa]